jgi:multidrug efflux pump subunit AcrA (membrane-fusion protein)
MGKVYVMLGNMAGRKPLMGVLLVAALGLFVLAVSTGVGNLGGPDQPLIYYTVTCGDLPITVTERGNLESQNNVDIFCEVDDINGDGIHGTTILWIVPNGSSVQEGDLLVELDVAGHQERLDQQILDLEKARAEQIQAKVKYENRITQNETAKANAELKVKLAKLELDMFEDEDKGTHRLDVEAIKREIEDVDNNILASRADLELKKNDMEGIEKLF